MNIEQARFNMIEQQIRTWEVLDPEVLELLGRVKREDFVPPEHRAIAFADLEIPLGHGESMMQPKVEARIVQELSIKPHEAVYEVGTGSGYLTSLLASRARQRVRGTPALPGGDLMRQRQVIDAFLAASRGGDFDALLALLDPSVVLRGDRAALPPVTPGERGLALGLRGGERDCIRAGGGPVLVRAHGVGLPAVFSHLWQRCY